MDYHFPMNITIDGAGRLVVPKSMRDHLGISAGSELSLEQRGDEILLKPVRSEGSLENVDGFLVYDDGKVSDVDLVAHLKEGRDDRARNQSGLSVK